VSVPFVVKWNSSRVAAVDGVIVISKFNDPFDAATCRSGGTVVGRTVVSTTVGAVTDVVVTGNVVDGRSSVAARATASAVSWLVDV
jgi:hypothetical protein